MDTLNSDMKSFLIAMNYEQLSFTYFRLREISACKLFMCLASFIHHREISAQSPLGLWTKEKKKIKREFMNENKTINEKKNENFF